MIKYSKLTNYQIKKIIQHFCIDIDATKTSELLKLNRQTINRYYLIFRKAIYLHQSLELNKIVRDVELDESYFGARRKRGFHGKLKRGRGTQKKPVFGIFKRDSLSGRECIYTEIVPDCKKATLQDNAPRPTSQYSTSANTCFWNETDTENTYNNTAKFDFGSTGVLGFGAWFGDLETRTDEDGLPAFVKIFGTNGVLISSTQVLPSTLNQANCGSPNTIGANFVGCGNQTTRWIGFNSTVPIGKMLVTVGDDDPCSIDTSDCKGHREHLSFLGMTLALPPVTTSSSIVSSSSQPSSSSSSVSSSNSSVSSITATSSNSSTSVSSSISSILSSSSAYISSLSSVSSAPSIILSSSKSISSISNVKLPINPNGGMITITKNSILSSSTKASSSSSVPNISSAIPVNQPTQVPPTVSSDSTYLFRPLNNQKGSTVRTGGF